MIDYDIRIIDYACQNIRIIDYTLCHNRLSPTLNLTTPTNLAHRRPPPPRSPTTMKFYHNT